MTRFIYFRDALVATNHNGIICAGYRCENNTVFLAFAFCSPLDRFEKQIARNIIKERLESGKCLRVELPEDVSFEKYADYVALVINIYNSNISNPSFAAGISAPSWAVRLITPHRPLMNEEEVSETE